MSFPQAVTDAVVLNYVAAVLKKGSVTQLLIDAGFWPQVVNQGHLQAVGRIWRTLIEKGYQPARIQLWDDLPTFETILSVGDSLMLGGGLSADTMDFMRSYEQYRGELATILITTNGGAWEAPGDTPGTFGMGQITAAGGSRLLPSGSGRERGDWDTPEATA